MRIAIVGAGISGVTLALRLQQLGVETTLVTDRTPDELRAGRLPNTVARFQHSLDRERTLGIDHWAGSGHAFFNCDLSVGPPLALGFTAHAAAAVEAVDFRVLLPRWIEDYAGRGGRVECRPLPDHPEAIVRLAAGHDLVVVAVGRASMSTLFPPDRSRSPYAEPQRLVLAALMDGLALPEPLALSFNVAPGAGELFQMPILTRDGLGTNLLIEAVPGGPLAGLVTGPPDEPGFIPALIDALKEHAPAIAARVDGNKLRVRSQADVLQGAITPTVRHAYARLADGTPALAIGDAWITNDPVTGQGANLGSHCAFAVADAIAGDGPFDEVWAARTENAMWAFAGPVTAWTNAFLQPPPTHIVELLVTASQHQPVANAFIDGFANPTSLAAALASPEATEAFIEAARSLEPVA